HGGQRPGASAGAGGGERGCAAGDRGGGRINFFGECREFCFFLRGALRGGEGGLLGARRGGGGGLGARLVGKHARRRRGGGAGVGNGGVARVDSCRIDAAAAGDSGVSGVRV